MASGGEHLERPVFAERRGDAAGAVQAHELILPALMKARGFKVERVQ